MDTIKFELLLKKVTQAVFTLQKLKENEINYQRQIDKLTSDNIRIHEENLELKKQIQILTNDVQSKNHLHKELEDKILEVLSYLPDDNDDLSENNSYDAKITNPYKESLPETSDMFTTDAVDDKNDPISSPVFTNTKIESEEDMLKQFINEESNDDNLFNNNLITNESQNINLSEKEKSEPVNEERTFFDESTITNDDNYSESELIESSFSDENPEPEENDILSDGTSLILNDSSPEPGNSHLFDDDNKEISFDFFDDKNTQEEELPRGVL